MIVERVADFLLSPKDSDRFAFDKNGRFIYVWRRVNNTISSLLVYDILFNDYVELSPDSSFSKLKHPDYDDVWFLNCVPVSAEQLLVVFVADRNYDVIVLIGIDFQQKTFGIVDTSFPVFHCYTATLVYTMNMKTFSDYFTYFYTMKTSSWGHMDKWAHTPSDLYLYQNKLWFVRSVKGSFRPPRSAIPLPPRDLSDDDYKFSYFDLSEESPTEKLVRTIELSHLVDPNISQLNWVKDAMILQITKTQLELFNLSSFEWSTMDANPDFCWTEDRGKQMEENWVNYQRNAHNLSAFWSENSPIHVDNQSFCSNFSQSKVWSFASSSYERTIQTHGHCLDSRVECWSSKLKSKAA